MGKQTNNAKKVKIVETGPIRDGYYGVVTTVSGREDKRREIVGPLDSPDNVRSSLLSKIKQLPWLKRKVGGNTHRTYPDGYRAANLLYVVWTEDKGMKIVDNGYVVPFDGGRNYMHLRSAYVQV